MPSAVAVRPRERLRAPRRARSLRGRDELSVVLANADVDGRVGIDRLQRSASRASGTVTLARGTVTVTASVFLSAGILADRCTSPVACANVAPSALSGTPSFVGYDRDDVDRFEAQSAHASRGGGLDLARADLRGRVLDAERAVALEDGTGARRR